MAAQDIAAAMQRVEAVLRRRPEAGLHDDAPALAQWTGGLRVRATHDDGTALVTDMPAEIGGAGEGVTPGWLLRAALASCAVTRIAMAAAAAGIELQTLQARALSRSDLRGLFGLCAPDGAPVTAGPGELQLLVRIGAAGVAAERLRSLVHQSCQCAPVSRAMEEALPVALQVEVEGSA
jgi:uncharacterized OsmC-like protein